MPIIDNLVEDIAKQAGALSGNAASENMHEATKTVVEDIGLLKWKRNNIPNAQFDTAKGNLFEYIEAAKFNQDAARHGETARAIVTEAAGDPHAAADIVIEKDGNVVKEIQAKVTNSAAASTFDHAGGQKGHWGKYNGMDRLVRKDDSYNENGSFADEVKKLAHSKANSNSPHANDYMDVESHVTDETFYNESSSGGTTQEELADAYSNIDKYSKNFELNQLKDDVVKTSATMATTTGISYGISSSIRNMFEVYKDEKELTEALEDVGVDVVKGTVRGGATGAISSVVRYGGVKSNIPVLADSTASTIIAGGVVDGGVAIYSYAKGEITEKELEQAIIDTTAKSVSTVYFTKAVATVLGKSVGPFVPMAIYTTASCVVSCTREIINNARLNAEEYKRLATVLEESTQMLNEYHEELKRNINEYNDTQRKKLTLCIDNLNYDVATGQNYNESIKAMVDFADAMGFTLQHADFDEFKEAMNSDEIFVLE